MTSCGEALIDFLIGKNVIPEKRKVAVYGCMGKTSDVELLSQGVLW